MFDRARTVSARRISRTSRSWYHRGVLPPLLHDVLADYRSKLERAFPGRLLRLTLFGSWARGEAHEDSDVDVLVVLDRATFAERSSAIELGATAGLEHGWPLAPLVLTVAEWAELERRERLLVREITRDGVTA